MGSADCPGRQSGCGMSEWKRFPAVYWEKRPEWVFRVLAKFWFTDKLEEHPETCVCEGCFLGPIQQELRL
jgi:hypothetical protein